MPKPQMTRSPEIEAHEVVKRLIALLVGTAAFALLWLGCSGSSDPAPAMAADDAPTIQAEAQPDPLTLSRAEPSGSDDEEAPPATPRPRIELRHPTERGHVERVLGVEDGSGDAPLVVSDRPLEGGARFVLGTWAAVVPQRHDVLDVPLSHLWGVLSGEIEDWAELGGRARPIAVLVAANQAQALQWSSGVSSFGDAVQLVRPSELIAAVRGTPGALAFLLLDQLEPGLLPLVIDGWDPLRDPADRSPIQGPRWIQARTAVASLEWARRLGWREPPALDPLGFVATGDFIPVRCVASAVRSIAGGDFREMFALVEARLRSADVVVVSMEVSATDLREPTPCRDRPNQFVLQADPAVLDALVAAGVDVVTTAGNHAGDCYTGCSSRHEAILDTVTELDARGLAHVGSGATEADARTPVLLERSGVRIAVLSYDAIAPWYWAEASSPGTAPAVAEAVAHDVAAALMLADHVVVALSWGEEYVQTTTPAQEAIVEAALAAGTSLIVGNHPHTVQPLVEREDAVVAYALGNFVFDQSWSAQTMQSVLLEVGFTRERLIGYRVRPIVIRRDFQPDLVSPRGVEGGQVLERLWAATDRWWIAQSQ